MVEAAAGRSTACTRVLRRGTPGFASLYRASWTLTEGVRVARSIKTELVTSIPVPAGAESPIAAYVNGAERTEGNGITVRDGRIWFDEPLRVPHPTSFGGKMMLTFGIGVYGDLKGDQLDLAFRRDGQPQWLTNIPLTRGSQPES
jgi:hypothetical protein